MPGKHYILHVLSHTHWDREWYQSFQGFRQRLVFQMSALLDLLDKRQDYRCFHLDGQTICLLDFLAVRPDELERLRKHIASGRILIGPWFVMPDELLLSGESLVRNLAFGHSICRKFDAQPMPIGYVTDIFGHCSQLPQIMRDFGIDCVFLHRGTTNADGASEMLWEGADGSTVLVIKAYPHTGYNDFLTYRYADEQTILDYERKKQQYARTSVLFALEGNDHEPAYWDTPEMIQRANSIMTNTLCVHSSMPDYLRHLKEELGDPVEAGLVTYRGELRHPMKSGMYAELFCGTASSRVPLKQANDELEWLLPRCAEPLNLWSFGLGGESQTAFLALAWQYLLSNHPHDSIVGCSIDQVHRDMHYRFDQARLVATNSIAESILAIGDRIDTAAYSDCYASVTVYNTSALEAGPVLEFFFEILEATVREQEAKGLKPALVDEFGQVAPFEIARVEHDMWPRPQVKKTYDSTPRFSRRPNAWLPHYRYHIRALGSVPAFGYRTWGVKFVPAETTVDIWPNNVPYIHADPILRIIENDYLKVLVREDALIELFDKATGQTYAGLHDLEDCGDAGHGWDHIYPVHDNVVRASQPGAKSRARISVEQLGRLEAVATISYDLSVPSKLTADRSARARSKTKLGIEIRITLKAGSRRLDFATTVHNTAECHRLRAIFPTNRSTDCWCADSAFDIVKRNIKLPDTRDFAEQAREETPVKNFGAIIDDRGGLAVLTKGLCEMAAQDSDDRPIALTLFRAFAQQIGDGWTRDSQLLGKLVLHYSLLPLDGDSNGGLLQVPAELERYKIGLIPLTDFPHSGDLQVQGTFLQISSGIVVSAVKLGDDGQSAIIRLYNPWDKEVLARLKFESPVNRIDKCDMMERPITELSMDETGDVVLTARPKEIVTLAARRTTN